jgi:DNA invertase Pin-like site-specific DNA recombinase
VVVYHLDRFARDVAALLDSISVYQRRGVELHVVGRGRMETRTASGYLGVAIEGVLSEHYRKVISEKTRDALSTLRAQGRRVSGRLPYGYSLAEDGVTLRPEPSEQVTLTTIRELAPGQSLRALASLLAQRGILSRSGRPFAAMTLSRVIRRDQALVTDRPLRDSTAHR